MNNPTSPHTKAPAVVSGLAPTGKKPAEHSFASLNFLRGLSAAAVLINHTATFVSSGKNLLTFNWGGLGVDMFMLISGFLMMWHFYERRNRGESWDSSQTCLKFYVRRFFRIAPLYYCLLILVYVFHNGLQQLGAHNQSVFQPTYLPGPHDPTSTEMSAAQVLTHFSFAFGFIPRYAASSPLPDWSIGLEMQFYLFFPFLALLLVRSQFIWGTALLLATSWISLKLFGVGVNASPGLLGVFPYPTLLPLKIDCFLVGMLLAAGLYEKDSFAKRTFLLLLGLLVAGIYMKKFLLICFLFAFYELALAYGTGLPPLDRTVKSASRVVGHRIFKFMADASYGVYLIHLPLLTVVIWLLTHLRSFVELSPVMRFISGLLVMIPLVYTLAFLAFKFIESPGIAWGRKIIKRMR
jgi:peptidoglycan/LPS O-acetylase OafA/YrhL